MNDWDIDPKLYTPVLGWFRKLLAQESKDEACCDPGCCGGKKLGASA